jgi:hypothetical protein
MTDSPTTATYRWSCDRSEDRFTVEAERTSMRSDIAMVGPGSYAIPAR